MHPLSICELAQQPTNQPINQSINQLKVGTKRDKERSWRVGMRRIVASMTYVVGEWLARREKKRKVVGTGSIFDIDKERKSGGRR